MRPVADARDEAVPHRVEMNVIDVACKIGLVADGVLPEPSLPKCIVPVRMAPRRRTRCDHMVAEMSLDPPPAPREIRISRRQGENRMQMIRQDYDGIDRVRAFTPAHAERRAQRADVIDKSR